MTFCNSRTLPGRACASNAARHAGEKPRLHAVFAREAMHELFGEKEHIFAAFAQRRHEHRHDVQAEVQILPEFLLLDALIEVAVGGGDDAHVHLDGARAADAFEFAFLQHAQQFGLHLRGNLADFIEQDRAAVREFKAAFAFVHRAGERAFLVTEEFALDEIFGTRRNSRG